MSAPCRSSRIECKFYYLVAYYAAAAAAAAAADACEKLSKLFIVVANTKISSRWARPGRQLPNNARRTPHAPAADSSNDFPNAACIIFVGWVSSNSGKMKSINKRTGKMAAKHAKYWTTCCRSSIMSRKLSRDSQDNRRRIRLTEGMIRGFYIPVSQEKTRHPTLAHNFAKCWPIFKIVSPSDLAAIV